jgi:hypothetical protein
VSAALPVWFGEASAAPVRIAGTVFGGQGPGSRDSRDSVTVRLAIDVPDPGIWTGREAAVAPDGTFDFGPMRPGRYLLVASGGTLRSRVTRLDTTAEPGDRAELYLYPCQRVVGELLKPAQAGDDHSGHVPAAGFALEIAGRVIGTTDARGAFDVCVLSSAELRLGTPGYEAAAYASGSVASRLRREQESQGGALHEQRLASEYAFTGRVIEGDGSPARGVGVQPIWASSGLRCVDASVVVTTDAAGRFRFGGSEALCGIRIWRGTTVYEAPYTEPQQNEPVEPVPPPPAPAVPYPTEPPLPPALELSPIIALSLDGGPAELTVQLATPTSVRKPFSGFGMGRGRPLGDPLGAWIRGRVTARGAPLGDALVALTLPRYQSVLGGDWPRVTTRSDGSFAMFVAVPQIDDPRIMILDVEDSGVEGSGRARAGRAAVEIASGQSRDGVAIDVGPGATLRGTVVDEQGRPRSDCQVGTTSALAGWSEAVLTKAPVEHDGSFQLAIARQGRHRLQVSGCGADECLPPPGRLWPAIDVERPSGQLPAVRVVVRCRPGFLSVDHWDPYLATGDSVPGMIDLGAVLDRDNVVVRIGNEAAAAGMRLGDKVIAVDGMAPGADLAEAFTVVSPGRELRWTVARGGAVLALHARAPWLGSAP